MSTTVLQQRRVLFVDDDASFLEMIRRVMDGLSRSSWEIFTAQNTGKALACLQDNAINMIVLDVQMPVVDGLQSLALLNRRYPNLQKVVLTGFANENYRAACLSNGAEMFLEKPKTAEGFESLFATLNELIKWQPEEGFRGVLRRVGLQDIIQMECLSRNSSILEIKAGKETGNIFIREGAIIHAAYGTRSGESALNYLLALRGGEFKLRSFAEPPTRTIEGAWEFLLMEAARLRDEIESENGGDLTGEPAISAETPAGEPDVSEREGETKGRTVVEERVNVALEAIPPLFAVKAKAPELPPAVAEPVEETEPAAIDSVAEVEALERRIDEVLICSSHGDVLYEWHCRNSDVWVNFLEFVSQKSRQASQGFLLGRFDRLEIESDGARMTAQINAGGGVLVRSSAVATDAVPAKSE